MKKIFFGIIAFVLFIFSCKTSTGSHQTKKVSLNLESKSGSQVIGTAIFTEKKGVVYMEAKLKNLKPGIHAIHIHEKADCSATDASSAGGHWNPTFKKHGKWTASEHHKGDIGNFIANSKGEGQIHFKTDEWCISCDDNTKNIVGKGLIVHENLDDFTTQPTGNAGARVACSAIIK